MPNAARFNFSILDLSYSISAIAKGISFVSGVTQRGPVANPSVLITSWPKFEKLYGGLVPGTDFPLICKRALEAGAALRVSRVVHYSDVTDAATITAVKAPAKNVPMGSDNLFQIRPKYHGADYNNLRIEISAASNGDVDSFNMRIYHISDSLINELYKNLKISGSPTVAQSTYLRKVSDDSQVVDVTYLDLSALTAPLRPTNATIAITGGSDGSTIVANDYVGDSAAKTGFNAFDSYDDALQICAPEMSADDIHIGGSAYAESRKDLMYFAHLSDVASDDLITTRQGLSIDSYYSAFFQGGLNVMDPRTGSRKDISEMGDVLACFAYSDRVAGPWFSAAGLRRGIIRNAYGVVNNFGGSGQYATLNQLANAQINSVVQEGGRIYLTGNFTGALAESRLSWINTVRFIVWLQKSMGPTLKRYLEEACDIPTFKALYREVKPFLDGLVTKRAMYSYVWDGDQDKDRIEDVQVNSLEDINLGKYKVRFFFKPIPSMNEIEVEIVVTAASVNFNLVASAQ